MMNKKLKQKLGLVFLIGGVLVGGMTTAASSYVQSNMPGYPSISCWGSISYGSKTIRATTSCNFSINIYYATSVSGEFLRYSTPLGTQTATGTGSAKIYNSEATGYKRATGTHHVYYRNATWTDYTSL